MRTKALCRERSSQFVWLLASLAVPIAAVSTQGMALAAEGLSAAETSDSLSYARQSGWSLLGSAGAGYAGVASDEYNSAPGGPQGLVSAELALMTTRWEFDGGLGWFYSQISGENKEQLPIEIRTRAGTVDLGARYRATERFQIGPAFNLAFGTDTAFGPDVGSTRGSLLMGLKGVYEISRGRFLLRAWAQLSSDLNIGDRRLILGLAGIQIGLPFTGGNPETPAVTPVAVSMPAPATQTVFTVVLDPKKVFFKTNSSKIKPDVMNILREVGALLHENADPGASISIAGHADQRGAFNYNLKLSRKRAESVHDALLDGGADPDALAVKAYSFLKPLDPRKSMDAFAKNRRVELRFDKIKNPELFKKKLGALELEHPETQEN